MNKGLWIGVVVVVAVIAGGLIIWNVTSSGNTASSTPTSVNTGGNGSGGSGNGTPSVPTVYTDPNVTVSNSTALVTGTVNPNGAQTKYWYEYGRTKSLGTQTSPSPIGSGFESIAAPGYITGLSADTSYYYRLDASNSFGTVQGSIQSFTTNTTPPPPVHLPSAKTSAATDTGRTAATVNGSVNPNGVRTSYWFEYGRTSDLGNSTDVQSAGNGTADVDATAQLSGLLPATKYYFRVNAENAYGTVLGSTLTFTTSGPPVVAAPDVTTLAATDVTSSSATLNGTVDPNGAETTYWFEYSTDQVFNTNVHTSGQQVLGPQVTPTNVSVPVSNLATDTTYYFRLVASNSVGTTRGNVLNFTTGPVTP